MIEPRAEDTISGSKTPGGRANRAFRPDRQCRTKGCTTTLSRYNPGPHCSAHAENGNFVRHRARGKAPKIAQ